MITDQQVDILNKLNKYLPAMRLWYHAGASGLGDILKSQQTSIDAIPGGTDPIDLVPGQPVTTFSTVPANASFGLSVEVTEAFDPGSILTLGIAGDPTLIAGPEITDLTEIGSYLVTPTITFNTDTDIIIYLTPTGSNGAVTVKRT